MCPLVALPEWVICEHVEYSILAIGMECVLVVGERRLDTYHNLRGSNAVDGIGERLRAPKICRRQIPKCVGLRVDADTATFAAKTDVGN